MNSTVEYHAMPILSLALIWALLGFAVFNLMKAMASPRAGLAVEVTPYLVATMLVIGLLFVLGYTWRSKSA
jgi:hypothetical protein